MFLFRPPKWAQFIYKHLSCKKTRRKNILCSGLCPILLLLRSFRYLVGSSLLCWDDWSKCEVSLVSLVIFLANWVVSWPPSLKEFVLEFRTLVNNIVSLFTKKIEIFLCWGCEPNFCSWSLGSAHGWILDTCHVCRECFGKKWFVCENPLRRWKPLGGVWRSSLKFFIKDVKHFKSLGNEKIRKKNTLEM